jgi:sugar lactone lactonase YvrE
MKFEIFDERISVLGESPFAFGEKSSEVSWADILGSRVRTRNLITGEVSEFGTGENVGFALRRTNGGYLLGTNSGPVLRDPDGTTQTLFSLQAVDPQCQSHSVRWNDAKVSPSGNLFLGTMAYSMLPKTSTLFRYSQPNRELDVVFPELTISNGMDWSDDGATFFFIDSSWQAVRAFSVENDQLSDGHNVIEIAPEDGAPDGMCMDAEGGIWVALWRGSEVRRYDSNNNFKLTERIQLPAKYITSCTFAGENLDTLIITSATDGEVGLAPESGMTFIAKPGVQGRPSRPYPN